MSGFRLFCLFNSHRPIRHQVKWDGISYTGVCKHCGARIQRRDSGGWRRTRQSLIGAEDN
ncbi:hypothetical protein SAMN05660666_00855 [Novosphingobium aromaticivorans]|nr:hypothetical protein SAMN05660666_00855 [Novosphingobium aromaticivorans]